MQYATRIPTELSPTSLGQALQQAAQDPEVVDLACSNPTRCGLLAAKTIHDALATGLGRSLREPYVPASQGMLEARTAVAQLVGGDAADVFLTASTSEAYGLLFKLFCEPGQSVAVPEPSYPLIEHLAAVEGVRSAPYRLELTPNRRFRLDPHEVLACLDASQARAVCIVSPHNPTGHCLKPATQRTLWQACAARGIPIIVDAVFSAYQTGALTHVPEVGSLKAAQAPGGAADPTEEPLVIVLDGLSKRLGLPQLKLGWGWVQGPAHLRQDFMQRWRWLSDLTLSVAAPVQLALPALLSQAQAATGPIAERIEANRQAARRVVSAATTIDVIDGDGGWALVLRIPHLMSEEAWVLRILRQARVRVHPGFFYDLPHPAFLVLSLLPPPGVFAKALERVVKLVETQACV